MERPRHARLSLEIDGFGLGFLDFDWGLPELPGEYRIGLTIAGESLGEWQLDTAADTRPPSPSPGDRPSPSFTTDRPSPALG